MYEADRKRMASLCSPLVAAYQANEYPYNHAKVNPPQVYIPDTIKANKKTYAYFLFILCLWMRGGIASDTAAKSLVKLYELDEGLFDPHWVMNFDPSKLKDLLDQFGLGRDSQLNAELWVGNTRLLVERWHGDPRLIFHDFDRYSEKKKWEVALKRIVNQGQRGRKGGFGGFREKMTSMLIYYLTETGLTSHFDTAIPVDIHVTRMVVIHRVFAVDFGVAYTGGQLAALLDAIRAETYRYAKTHNVSSVELCDALWLYSRSMCSRSPAFRSSIGEIRGRSTEIRPYNPRWSAAEQRTYANTCGRCLVNETCRGVVRAAYWYHRGSLVVEERLTPTQLSLFPPVQNRSLY